MKLTDLVKFLINPDKLDELYTAQKLNSDSEALLIYLREDLNIDSDISILEIEETDDELIFEKDNVKYIQLFPLKHSIDLIEFDLGLKDKGFTDLEIARRLLNYRKNDA